eukprot:1400377-Pleurochrysis_carterae.AAC.1
MIDLPLASSNPPVSRCSLAPTGWGESLKGSHLSPARPCLTQARSHLRASPTAKTLRSDGISTSPPRVTCVRHASKVVARGEDAWTRAMRRARDSVGAAEERSKTEIKIGQRRGSGRHSGSGQEAETRQSEAARDAGMRPLDRQEREQRRVRVERGRGARARQAVGRGRSAARVRARRKSDRRRKAIDREKLNIVNAINKKARGINAKACRQQSTRVISFLRSAATNDDKAAWRACKSMSHSKRSRARSHPSPLARVDLSRLRSLDADRSTISTQS